MKDLLKLFTRQILIFSAFIAFIAVIISFFFPAKTVTPAMPGLIVFFMAIAWLIIRYLMRATGQSFIRFVNAYMLSTGLKLVLLILVIVGYLLLNRQDAVPFLMAFFILYLCYTGFEVYAVLYLSKIQKKSE